MKISYLISQLAKYSNSQSELNLDTYVGFYFMPVYTNPEIEKFFPKDLLKLKKGKSCFHIKSLDKNLEKQIKQALEKGYKLYKKRGWI